jgi:hypothetical protein
VEKVLMRKAAAQKPLEHILIVKELAEKLADKVLTKKAQVQQLLV